MRDAVELAGRALLKGDAIAARLAIFLSASRCDLLKSPRFD
jgi:hypothetical protein